MTFITNLIKQSKSDRKSNKLKKTQIFAINWYIILHYEGEIVKLCWDYWLIVQLTVQYEDLDKTTRIACGR